MRQIRLTRTAERDLEAIWSYTREVWSAAQAEAYLEALTKGFLMLLDHPALGKARPDLRDGLRSLAVEHHLVFYEIAPSFLDILAVLHKRQDARLYFGTL